MMATRRSCGALLARELQQFRSIGPRGFARGCTTSPTMRMVSHLKPQAALVHAPFRQYQDHADPQAVSHRGNHTVIDIKNADVLGDEAAVRAKGSFLVETLARFARDECLKVLTTHLEVFDDKSAPPGFACVVHLDEYHISARSYSDTGTMAIDVLANCVDPGVTDRISKRICKQVALMWPEAIVDVSSTPLGTAADEPTHSSLASSPTTLAPAAPAKTPSLDVPGIPFSTLMWPEVAVDVSSAPFGTAADEPTPSSLASSPTTSSAPAAPDKTSSLDVPGIPFSTLMWPEVVVDVSSTPLGTAADEPTPASLTGSPTASLAPAAPAKTSALDVSGIPFSTLLWPEVAVDVSSTPLGTAADEPTPSSVASSPTTSMAPTASAKTSSLDVSGIPFSALMWPEAAVDVSSTPLGTAADEQTPSSLASSPTTLAPAAPAKTSSLDVSDIPFSTLMWPEVAVDASSTPLGTAANEPTHSSFASSRPSSLAPAAPPKTSSADVSGKPLDTAADEPIPFFPTIIASLAPAAPAKTSSADVSSSPAVGTTSSLAPAAPAKTSSADVSGIPVGTAPEEPIPYFPTIITSLAPAAPTKTSSADASSSPLGTAADEPTPSSLANSPTAALAPAAPSKTASQGRGEKHSAVTAFVRHHFRNSNAATVVDAANGYRSHLDDGGVMLLSMAGATNTSEIGLSLAEMIRKGKVHALSVSGANLEQDFFNLVAHESYTRVPHWREHFEAGNHALHDTSCNLVTDTEEEAFRRAICIPEQEAFRRCERAMTKIYFEAASKGERLAPHEVFYRLILRHTLTQYYEIDAKDSWLVAAAEADLPIVCHGWEDSTCGNMLVSLKLKGLVKEYPVKSGLEQMEPLVNWYSKQNAAGRRVGFFQIGGGIAGDFAMCSVPLIRQDFGGDAVGQQSYFAQIADGTTPSGGYSVAPPMEKEAWGKLAPATPSFVIESDASIVWPLFSALVLDP